MNMNKKLHATIGLSAAILALGLSSSALADEQELPVSLPATEALDNTSFENLVVENIPASAVDVNLTSESVAQLLLLILPLRLTQRALLSLARK